MTAAIDLLAALRIKAGADFAHRADVAPWCSIDRAGERHVFTLLFGDAASAGRLLDGLNDHEFALPNDVVADVQAYIDATDSGVQVTVEALTFPLD